MWRLAALPLALALDTVVLVTRHGERERLWKDHLTQAEQEDGGPRLTGQGAAEQQALGRALRRRYMAPDCEAQCLQGRAGQGVYDPTEVRAESSGLARTLGSAYALHSGLFPLGSVPSNVSGLVVPVPVYSRPKGNDFILRGYTKCAAQARNLEEWLQNTEFQTKAQESRAFRIRVAEALGRVNVSEDGTAAPLADWWNTYDELAVAAQDGSGVVNSSDLQRAEELAAWLEAKKYGERLAGNRCGGALLSKIMEDLSNPSLRLVHYSAHYATMLCLLTALGVSVDGLHPAAWLGAELLGLGSVLALEKSQGQVELYYWPGTDSSTQTWRKVELPCVSGAVLGTCTEQQLRSLDGMRGLKTLKAWCRACDNFALDLCEAGQAPPEEVVTPEQWDLPAIIFVFMGVGASAFLAAGCYAFRQQCCARQDEERRGIVALEQRVGMGACSPAPSL